MNNSKDLNLVQIQDHFIFNALNTVKGSVLLGKMESTELMNSFAVYLRYQFLAIRQQSFLPLQQEAKMLHAFAVLEMARYSGIHILVDLEEADIDLPPMSTQILLTNGIFHCLLTRERAGRVEMTGRETETGYEIQVWDNGLLPEDNEVHPNGVKEMAGQEYLTKWMLEKQGAVLQYRKESERNGQVVWIPEKEESV